MQPDMTEVCKDYWKAQEAESSNTGADKPEMLGANVKIADKPKIEGQKGVEAGGWRLQHGDNVNGLGPAFADGVRSCHKVPHACTPATSLSEATMGL